MGLNTLGMAGRAVLHSVGGSEPDSLRTISGRFAKPAFNGDGLKTQIWVVDEGAGTGPAGTRDVIYRVLNQEGVVVLDRGHALVSLDRWP
jgi:acyl dehydratase